MSEVGAVPRALAIAVLVSAAALAMAASAGAQGSLFGRCPQGVGPRGAQCGTVIVPLDRSGTVPGNVGLFTERVPTGRGGGGGVVIALAGGPGQAAVPLAEDFLLTLGPALRGRQLVLFDQRGTGRSGVVRCPELERARGDDPRDYAKCAAELGPRRAFYTTPDSVEDVEAIRRALGVDRITLYGASYGTKVALAYAQAHPDHVDRLVLDSVVAPEGPDPFVRSTFAAIPRVLRELCSDGGCRGITGDPVADLARLVARLRSGPLRGPLIDVRGRPHGRNVGRVSLFNTLVEGDLDPTIRAELPGAVRSALRKDAAPLLRLIRRATGIEQNPPVRELSEGLFAATTCEETAFPWDRGAAPADRERQMQAALNTVPDSAFTPFDRSTALASPLLTVCSMWPTASPPPPAGMQSLPPVEALVLAGRDDLRTPLEDAGSVAQRIQGSRFVAIPQTGHSVLGSDLTGCAERELKAFFQDFAPRNCPPGRRLFPPTPVAPVSLKEIPPAPRMHGNPGRIAAAFGFTLADAERQGIGESIDLTDARPSSVVRAGGLRGGGFTLTSDRLILRRYEYLGGLRVSARLGGKRPVRLHVRGRFANGTLVLHGLGLVTGRLSGQRVHFRISSGYRFPDSSSIADVRAAAASLGRDRFGGDLRPPRPAPSAARGELPAGGVDVTPAG